MQVSLHENDTNNHRCRNQRHKNARGEGGGVQGHGSPTIMNAEQTWRIQQGSEPPGSFCLPPSSGIILVDESLLFVPWNPGKHFLDVPLCYPHLSKTCMYPAIPCLPAPCGSHDSIETWLQLSTA